MTKILAVDNNATHRKLVAALLNFEGFQAIEAIDGQLRICTTLAFRCRSN
jgi:CheY-like chemotaxis protein